MAKKFPESHEEWPLLGRERLLFTRPKLSICFFHLFSGELKIIRGLGVEGLGSRWEIVGYAISGTTNLVFSPLVGSILGRSERQRGLGLYYY